ncbi:ribbon-helix-helix CopG family protein [Roseiarcus fermentans]|uniref:Ribbon-helix-helix CopG family protein n=1 Tax=Roseiarcus fermentans TaxID=1473586 RepID=A0A366EMB9_9HYPH|nr:ribbon-helix-helix CopG family protein [Roseiarcus fermentans]
MLALRLPEDIESRLDELARRTGRSMSSYAREAIVEKIDELEAAQRPTRTFSLDEVERLVRSRAPGAVIRREGDRLVVEKPAVTGLIEWLKSIEPLDEEFPDVDAGLLPLDEPDIGQEVHDIQLQPNGGVRVLQIAAKGRVAHGPSVIARWEAGTVKDGRPTLFGDDIDVPDSTLFHVRKKDSRKQQGSKSRARIEFILSGADKTVGEYRKRFGEKLANDDIAWDVNHDFYCLVVPL